MSFVPPRSESRGSIPSLRCHASFTAVAVAIAAVAVAKALPRRGTVTAQDGFANACVDRRKYCVSRAFGFLTATTAAADMFVTHCTALALQGVSALLCKSTVLQKHGFTVKHNKQVTFVIS